MKSHDSYLPAAFALYRTTWNFEEAARAVPACDFLDRAFWTSNQMAILAVDEVFQRIERKVGSSRAGVKGPLLFFFFFI